jgi:uncharacterized protein YcbX
VTLTLTALYRYPVKSLRGIRMATARATARGLAGDRRWMLVDTDGTFITQRSQPFLTLLAAEPREDGGLVLRAHNGDGMAVDPPATSHDPASGRAPGRAAASGSGGGRLDVRVWDSHLQAEAASAAVNDWLSARLGVACRLVYQPDDAVRPLAPGDGRPGEEVSLADGFPYLLTSEESLADLNGRLATPVSMERFRPNLVVGGAPAFAEDGWRRIAVGDVVFRAVKPCSRCRVVTVDPATGLAGPEPLRTLARYRTRPGGVMFGVNLVAEEGIPGELRVGAPVTIVA